MIFSAIPALVNAQKGCHGGCPKGYKCYNGNCYPNFPPPCRGCGIGLINSPSSNDAFSIVANSNRINFQLEQTQNVSAKIYDETGRLIKTIVEAQMQAGIHQLTWNEKGNEIASGIYLLRFEANNKMETRKLLVMN